MAKARGRPTASVPASAGSGRPEETPRNDGGTLMRHRCPKCFFASDTEKECSTLTCRGSEMEPAPDAILDGDLYTPELFQAGAFAERRLFNRNPPDRFVRPIAGFRGAPEQKVERLPSTLHSFQAPDPTVIELDREVAGFLREWK